MENNNYLPKLITPEPKLIIPFHDVLEVRMGLVLDYINNRYVPAIPLLRAPEDLRKYGEFVNYNGHHRTRAAKRAGVMKSGFKPTCMLLEKWEDIQYLIDNPPEFNGEVYPELIEGLENNFKDHRDFIWDEARRFNALKEKMDKSSSPIYLKLPFSNI